MKDLLLKACHAFKASNCINLYVDDWQSATQQRNQARAARAKGFRHNGQSQSYHSHIRNVVVIFSQK